MANIGSIEATLEVPTSGFERQMDGAEKKFDSLTQTAESSVAKIESIGLKMAAVGAAISAAFGLAAKTADEQEQALGRLDSAARELGLSYADLNDQVMPLIDNLEWFGAGGRTELLDVFSRMLRSTKDVGVAMEALDLSVRLSASGMGNLRRIARSLEAAFAGDAMALIMLDRAFRPVVDKWTKAATEIGKANAQIGMTAEIMEVLRRRATFAPDITPWQKFTIVMQRVRRDIGEVVIDALYPLFQALADGAEVGRAFAKTGLGRIAIIGTTVAGILMTLGGVLLIFSAQVIKAAQAVRAFAASNALLSGSLKLVSMHLVAIVAMAGALQAGLGIANLLNQWNDFRRVIQRVFAAMSFGAEKIKGWFGRGNQELAQAYWDIASGKIAVGDEAPETINLLDIIRTKIDEIRGAASRNAELTAEQIDLNEHLQALWQQMLTDEAALAEAQRKTDEERLAALAERSEAEQKAMEERKAALRGSKDVMAEDLASPWEEATRSVLMFGEIARSTINIMSSLAGGLADEFANRLTGAIGSAQKSWGEFFTGFMRQILAMIVRATLLSALLSLLPGGPGFGAGLSKFFGMAGKAGSAANIGGKTFDDPFNDLLARREGGRLVDLFIGGMQTRLSASAGRTQVSKQGVAQSSGMQPVVEVHEATEMTWVRVTDRFISPRMDDISAARTEST